MRRFVVYVLVIAGCAAVGPSPRAQAPDTLPPPETNAQYAQELHDWLGARADQPAAKVFENIEVMKDLPAGRLIAIMENGFAPGLGVGCDFCHDVNDWASDTKTPKRTARAMWRMNGGIRDQLREIAGPEASITCYTCHRGRKKPATEPAEGSHASSATPERE